MSSELTEEYIFYIEISEFRGGSGNLNNTYK